MARKPSLDESSLPKMQVRKLNFLRTSIGDDLGTSAFLQWQKSRPTAPKTAPVDKAAEAIGEAIMGLIDSRKIKRIPRGGYVVRRGRGRVVVEAAD